MESRNRRTLPDTFFLCEYDFESEEYEDLCDRIDSVLKENTVPLLPFNRESVSEEVKKTTETFFGDYVFGGCLHTTSYQSLIKMIQTNKEQSDIQELQNLILEKKEMLRHVLHEKDLLLTNNLTTKLSFDKLNLDYSWILHETTEEYSKKYLKDNNLNDEYANIFDVLEDLQNKIDDIKCLLEKKVNELYKQEINNIKIVNK